MPYFIFKISERPIRMLEKLEEHASYRDAAARVKELRAEHSGDASYVVKMIFAETELHAEDLLNQVREPNPDPDD
ncbi:MAG: hypothetical protein M0P59_00445 [Gallionella sp.]|jgi:hypothetical protein|nr:hypothetical protein [Gallionella sp.]MCK9352609.1 hypothetical protein [Gallionella sp.]